MSDYSAINSLVLEMVDRVVAAESLTDNSTPSDSIVNVETSTVDIHAIDEPVQDVSINVSDKDSLIFALMAAKLKADIGFYRTKWRGLDKSKISEEDNNTMTSLDRFRRSFSRSRPAPLRKLIENFATSLRISLKSHYRIDDWKTIQQSFNEIHGNELYRIHLFRTDNDTCQRVWSGSTPSQRNVIILQNGNVFSSPTNLGKLLRQRFFCGNCLETSKFKSSHRCDANCRDCGESMLICRPTSGEYMKQCDDCKVTFLSELCMERHKKLSNNGSTRCNVVKYCESCRQVYNLTRLKGEKHECHTRYCPLCKLYTPPSKKHACYIRMPTAAAKLRLKEKEKTLKMIIFDFECSQHTGDHVVICSISKKVCYYCAESTLRDVDCQCDKCGDRKKVISYINSEDVLGDFIDYLFQPEHNQTFLFAHYGGKYDFILLLKSMLARNIIPQVIMNGRRIICGKVTHNGCTIFMRDSYNLIPLPLAQFASSFGITIVESKGEFPFKLIRPENYGLVMNGLPEQSYYSTGSKSIESLKAFQEWYSKHDESYIFEFDSALHSYCENDVNLTMLGILEYRKAMLKITNWDPCFNSVTLPSFTMHIMRHEHLLDRQICRTPDNGYANRCQSQMALKWLKYLMHTTPGLYIQHAGNSGEKRIMTAELAAFVDGFSVDENGQETCYEFYGSYYHGEPRVFPPNEMNKLCQQTYGSLYAATMTRIKKIEKRYKLIYVWEHDIKKELRRNRAMRKFFDECITTRLEPRLGMCGGRTEAHAVIAQSDSENEVLYADVNSLYPWVMSSGEFPIGAPIIHTSGFPEVPCRKFPYRGLAHVSVVAPAGLRYPVLGLKMHKQLLFILCFKCAQTRSQTRCNHTPSERAITSTFTHVELELVWEYKTFSKTLFKDYVSGFFTQKIAASGWPSWVSTEEDKMKCLQNYKDTMGIELTADQIEKNQGKRLVTKLLLNSSWGKFCERVARRETRFCNEEELAELLRTNRNIDYKRMTDDIFIITITMPEEEVHSSPFASVPLACYVTSLARLELYKMLEASNNRGVYTDTDKYHSIFAVVPRNNNPFKDMIKDGLGFLTNEYPNHEIKSVVFGGAKQYAIHLVSKTTGESSYTYRIRGVTLDSDARHKLTFEKFKQIVLDKSSITFSRFNLKRSYTGITTQLESKTYKSVHNKGVHSDVKDPNIFGIVYPYGYNPS